MNKNNNLKNSLVNNMKNYVNNLPTKQDMLNQLEAIKDEIKSELNEKMIKKSKNGFYALHIGLNEFPNSLLKICSQYAHCYFNQKKVIYEFLKKIYKKDKIKVEPDREEGSDCPCELYTLYYFIWKK